MKKKLKYFIEPNIGSNFIDFKISHTRPTIKSAFKISEQIGREKIKLIMLFIPIKKGIKQSEGKKEVVVRQ